MKTFKIENKIHISFGNGSVYVPHKKKMLKDLNWKASAWIAQNPNTPTKILKKFSKDKNFIVRFGVAQNPNTPIHTLKKLAEDEDAWVKNKAQNTLKNKQ